MDIAAQLENVRRRIARAAAGAGRSAEAVTLIAVSKTIPAPAIEAAIAAGQRVFGENRVQEAKAKWPQIKARFPEVELHLIGPLQTNKAADAVALFDSIQSLDRPKLARILVEEMKRQNRRPRLFVQVNTGAEPQKAGVDVAAADAFIAQCRSEFGLEVSGLMCIPPLDQDPRPHFAALAEIARRNGIAALSIGMSGDFEAAIARGATHVRIGTAIFGARSLP